MVKLESTVGLQGARCNDKAASVSFSLVVFSPIQLLVCRSQVIFCSFNLLLLSFALLKISFRELEGPSVVGRRGEKVVRPSSDFMDIGSG